ncbi:MAG: PEP-CTERM sorting domain-containing protein [Phycisphaerales bacterium]|nr:PEP-CTERM sorting domain-containing protein [Phycisphaerales bacterium]
MFSRKTAIACASAAALSLTGISATQAAVAWSGQNWVENLGDAAVNVDGNLELTTSHETYPGSGDYVGQTYYTTDNAFRSSSTPYVKVTFTDSGSGVGPYLAFDKETGFNNGWAEIGANPLNDVTEDHYSIYWDNFGGAYHPVDLGARTAGDHTVQIGRRSDGTLDFWFDGSLKYSSDFNVINPSYMEYVYLAAAGTSASDVATFKNFESGTNYVVPEPSTITLLGIGAAALLMRRRRRA